MYNLLDKCLGGLLRQARIIKWGAIAFTALAAIAAEPQPTNDNFANATVITGAAGTILGRNVGATAQPGEPDDAGNPGGPYESIWYEWTAPFTGSIEID